MDILTRFKIDKYVRDRDIYAGMEVAYKVKDTDQIERLRLLYGDNISLLEFLLSKIKRLKQNSNQLAETRITILFLGADASFGNDSIISIYSKELIDNYLEILKWLKNKDSLDDLEPKALNSLVTFTVNLKFITQISPEYSSTIIEFVKKNNLENVISDVLNSYEEYIIEHEDLFNIRIYHFFCELNIKLLKVHKDFQDYNLYTLDSSTKFINNYFNNLIPVPDPTIQDLENSKIELFILYYHLYLNRKYFSINNFDLIVIESIENLLGLYFNDSIANIIGGRTNETDISIGNFCYFLSDTYNKASYGQLGMYFKLLGHLYFSNYEEALDTFKNNKSILTNFVLPDYMQSENYSIDELVFTLYLQQIEYLDDISFKLDIIINDIETLVTDGYLERNLFEFLLSIYDKDRTFYDFRKSFRFFQVKVQCQILFYFLHSNKTRTIENIKRWKDGKNLEILESYEGLFSEDIILGFKKFYTIFSSDQEELIENVNPMPMVYSFHWNYITDILNDKEFDLSTLRPYIQKLGISTINLSNNENISYECFYYFIQIWSKSQNLFKGRGNKGFNKKNYYKICRKIKQDIEKKYKGISLFYWKLSERNIIDEINILLEKSK